MRLIYFISLILIHFSQVFSYIGLTWSHFRRSCNTHEVGSLDRQQAISSSNIGRPHTDESKAKISQANKGKTPWNAGIGHSEETKRKIAERTKAAMLLRKQNAASALGLTIEEFDAKKKEERKAKAALKRKGGLTEEGRKRISDCMKARWRDPEYRKAYSENRQRNFHGHSEETKARISAAIKEKWKDNEYRSRLEGTERSPEVRERISNSLKARWQDPEFREQMMESAGTRTDEWREAISKAVRKRYEEDPSYRIRVSSGIRTAISKRSPNSMSRKRRSGSNSRNSSNRLSKPRKLGVEEAKQRKKDAKEQRKQKEKQRARKLSEAVQTFQQKKEQEQAAEAAGVQSKSNGVSGKSTTLKDLLGGEMWFEEKLRRTRDGDPFLDDASLEQQLGQEWGGEARDVDGLLVDNEDDAENDEDVELHDWDLYEQEEIEDVIEVYDENGNLVASYSAEEYDRLRKG